ncbi:unnamed protein product, partial [Ilex paraguariensis]
MEKASLWAGLSQGARSGIAGHYARPGERAGERAMPAGSSMLGELGAVVVDARHGATQVQEEGMPGVRHH